MNRPSFEVRRDDAGRTLSAVVKSHWGLSWSQARSLIESRQVRVDREVVADPVWRVARGARVAWFDRTGRKRSVARQPAAPAVKRSDWPAVVVYADEDIVVANKPAGVTTMRHADEAAEFGPRGQRYLPETLADQLRGQFGPLVAVHRIDRDTSGLVVFARTIEAAKQLGKQFRAHTVRRRYWAIVRGRPSEGRIESWLTRDRGDGRRGSGPSQSGQRAITNVHIVEPLGPCTLIECRLETGRTHQIRIHLGEAGAPLAGETIYDRPIHGAPAPDPSGAPRLALHAYLLGFYHPTTGESVEWRSPLPADLAAVVERLRAAK